MAQTLYGLGGKRGLDDDATAGTMYFDSLTVSTSEEEVTVEDHIGEVIGLSLGNQTTTVSGSGVTKVAGAQAQPVGGVLPALANSDMWTTDADILSTVFFVTEKSFERQSKQWETGTFTAKGWAGLVDNTGTEQA